jgi:hypothetical protein
MEHDLRPRTVSLEHQVSSHHSRLSALEEWKQQSQIYDAKKEEQFNSMQALFNMRFTAIEEKLTAIGGTMTWLMRISLGVIVTSVVIFLVKGGFNLP